MSSRINNNFLTNEEIIRYNRQIILPSVGLDGQIKLKNSRILCIGAGGIASPLLLYLTAAGIGTIGIIDNDKVELPNLQRQILYSTKQIGNLKVISAKERLLELNPNINIVSYNFRLSSKNALSIITQYDIIVDSTDNFSSRYLTNDACFHLKKPYVYSSIFQFEGQCSVFTTLNGPCYRCLYESPPPLGIIPSCTEGGVFGALPGLIGSIQCAEVIKLILNIGQPLVGRLLTIDVLTLQFYEFNLQRDPNCPLCTYQKPFFDLHHYEENTYINQTKIEEISVNELAEIQEKKLDFLLLDVRELNEYNICNLGGKLIPLSQLMERLHELDITQFIVVYCKSGIRSKQAVKILLKAGFLQVKNLKGGIIAWRNEIDFSLPVY